MCGRSQSGGSTTNRKHWCSETLVKSLWTLPPLLGFWFWTWISILVQWHIFIFFWWVCKILEFLKVTSSHVSCDSKQKLIDWFTKMFLMFRNTIHMNRCSWWNRKSFYLLIYYLFDVWRQPIGGLKSPNTPRSTERLNFINTPWKSHGAYLWFCTS